MARPAKVFDEALDSRGKDTESGSDLVPLRPRFSGSGSVRFRGKGYGGTDRAELHAVAGARQRRLGTVQVPHEGFRAADQLPASGGLAWIHRRIVSGQGHRPRRDGGAW